MSGKTESLTKVEYVLQWFDGRKMWTDWAHHLIGHKAKADAVNSKRERKKAFPTFKFRIVKRTIIDEVED